MAGNTYRIQQRLKNEIAILERQQEELRPALDYLYQLFIKKMKEEELSARDAFQMFLKLSEQYTNSILLLTKVQEVIDFERIR